jgi:hypothetical protein
MMLPLERRDFSHVKAGAAFPWKACKPFVENPRGTLIHRPREAMTYCLHRLPHIGVTFWCGMATTDDKGRLTFLDAPPDGSIVCERCEAAAVKAGLPGADELAGKHVHKGRTVAVATCCTQSS